MNPISPSTHQSKILHVRELSSQIFRIRFENKVLAQQVLPGQFINIKVGDNYIPLWRRPFSIHRINKNNGWVEILFRVIGQGTKMLSLKREGDSLDYVGPLGNSFNYSEDTTESAIIISGGLGIAPFFFLSQILAEKEVTSHVFWGMKTASEFCALDELNAKTYLSTDDGSTGFNGFVTDLAENRMNDLIVPGKTTIFSCGPDPMLQRVSKMAVKFGLPCQVSLETLMACGLGACLGCGVKTSREETDYLYVCKDGPVFNSNEIDLSD